jgi:2-phosphoglycerate kinase
MRLRYQDSEAPYPLTVLRGRLRLSGLTDIEVASIIDDASRKANNIRALNEEDFMSCIEESLKEYPSDILQNFQSLTKYDKIRGESTTLPALILILEGASATGKSMLALELMAELAVTRFISTDTIRQILRGISSNQSHPELYCHTYQAYAYKQSGSPSLDPVVRGYIAQSELVMPYVQDLVNRLIAEGTIGLIEGVHIQPGIFEGTSSGILEVMINPSIETHRELFLGKHMTGKLRTVSSDISTRNREFEATRLIQDYMLSCALKHNVPVIPLKSYETARIEISKLIVKSVRNLMKNHS